MKPDLELGKKLDRYAIIISIIVLIIVGGMRQVKVDLGIDFTFLPPVYSFLNLCTAIFLVAALYQIKQKNIKKHQLYINISMMLSVFFLACYVLYHITTPETKYGGEGFIRTVYFILLITHIILAAIVLPLILFTYIRGFTNQIDKHRKFAKWTFPIWLYVAISGPICYLMLYPYY